MEIVVHDGLALGGGEHSGAQADQAAGGDGEFQMDVALAVVHADHFAAAIADEFHHAAEIFLRNVDHEVFDRFEEVAGIVFFAG